MTYRELQKRPYESLVSCPDATPPKPYYQVHYAINAPAFRHTEWKLMSMGRRMKRGRRKSGRKKWHVVTSVIAKLCDNVTLTQVDKDN